MKKNLKTLIESIIQEEMERNSLFHTTAWGALPDIIKSKALKPKSYDDFVSFSPEPFFGDISANDVVLEVSPLSNMMKVEYDEDWYNEHPEHASYIAGEGWKDQYFAPEECMDDDGWVDDECEEEAFREAELDSFLFKSSENEWISIKEGENVPIEIKTIWVTKEEDREKAQKFSGGKYPIKIL